MAHLQIQGVCKMTFGDGMKQLLLYGCSNPRCSNYSKEEKFQTYGNIPVGHGSNRCLKCGAPMEPKHNIDATEEELARADKAIGRSVHFIWGGY